jgi:hypothetical protein
MDTYRAVGVHHLQVLLATVDPVETLKDIGRVAKAGVG